MIENLAKHFMETSATIWKFAPPCCGETGYIILIMSGEMKGDKCADPRSM